MISRRRFGALLATLSATRMPLFASGMAQVGRLYIGTGGSGPGNGIMTADWNRQTGEIGPLTLAAEVASPTFLATFRQPSGEHFLYAISEASGPQAKVSAFTTVAGTGKLKLLNSVSSGGDGPAHVSVSPDGRTVLVSNYGGGSVSSFLVQPDGSLSLAVSHFQFSGSGPNHQRQDKPHTHSAVTSPDGRFALVNDLGLDRIMLFHLDAATATLTPCDPPFWSGKPGSGPRHLAWNKNGRFVYSANELASTVDTLAWSESPAGLRATQTVSSLPPGFPAGTAFLGEIVASADGRNVYAGNRVADDTIAVFDVNQEDGTLIQKAFAASGGKNCRHIALDPSGKWMVISHQTSNDVTVLARDETTGKLSEP
ncbi:MAG: lactonase family protein, partial [Janthinobacterium lividum]